MSENNTTKIAGIIHDYLRAKKHNIKRAHALELAARIAGKRDHHQVVAESKANRLSGRKKPVCLKAPCAQSSSVLLSNRGSFSEEHARWTREEYQIEAGMGKTQLGYWDWVEHRVLQDHAEGKHFCPHCSADLGLGDALLRRYTNKDSSGDEDSDHPDVLSHGHLAPDGSFEPDHSVCLSSGRYDLLDDSDTCASCGDVPFFVINKPHAVTLVSELERDPDNAEYNAALDGMESLLLALHAAGFNLTTPKATEAIQTSLVAIENHFQE